VSGRHGRGERIRASGLLQRCLRRPLLARRRAVMSLRERNAAAGAELERQETTVDEFVDRSYHTLLTSQTHHGPVPGFQFGWFGFGNIALQ
jgi:hypothetical protein